MDRIILNQIRNSRTKHRSHFKLFQIYTYIFRKYQIILWNLKSKQFYKITRIEKLLKRPLPYFETRKSMSMTRALIIEIIFQRHK